MDKKIRSLQDALDNGYAEIQYKHYEQILEEIQELCNILEKDKLAYFYLPPLLNHNFKGFERLDESGNFSRTIKSIDQEEVGISIKEDIIKTIEAYKSKNKNKLFDNHEFDLILNYIKIEKEVVYNSFFLCSFLEDIIKSIRNDSYEITIKSKSEYENLKSQINKYQYCNEIESKIKTIKNIDIKITVNEESLTGFELYIAIIDNMKKDNQENIANSVMIDVYHKNNGIKTLPFYFIDFILNNSHFKNKYYLGLYKTTKNCKVEFKILETDIYKNNIIKEKIAKSITEITIGERYISIVNINNEDYLLIDTHYLDIILYDANLFKYLKFNELIVEIGDRKYNLIDENDISLLAMIYYGDIKIETRDNTKNPNLLENDFYDRASMNDYMHDIFHDEFILKYRKAHKYYISKDD